ncbi:MAG: hypothetical protein FRX49_03336 [Trebouxia sp. A1-2]|nr:MAG: hypothetical protein FRX49_03336 [Trebouxia sp. A1-2]
MPECMTDGGNAVIGGTAKAKVCKCQTSGQVWTAYRRHEDDIPAGCSMGEDDNVGVHVHLCLLLQAHILQGYAHPVMQFGVLDGISRSWGEAVQSLNCALECSVPVNRIINGVNEDSGEVRDCIAQGTMGARSGLCTQAHYATKFDTFNNLAKGKQA